jgi:hypothetical protein
VLSPTQFQQRLLSYLLCQEVLIFLFVALAQTAVEVEYDPKLFDLYPSKRDEPPQPLFELFRAMYESEVMAPVMPYHKEMPLDVQRLQEAFGPGSKRIAELRRICALWGVSDEPTQGEVDERIRELFFANTLLLAGSGRAGRAPRVDFFLMHFFNATVFLPSVLPVLRPRSRALLLRALLPAIFSYVTILGRPRLDAALLMSYPVTPLPPQAPTVSPSADALGDPFVGGNPWPALITNALHSPDPHVAKATRALIYAAQRYGVTPAGSVPGALRQDGSEVLPGMAKLDGSAFVRAAGVLMQAMGWVTHGEKASEFDRSGLGWDDAWKED